MNTRETSQAHSALLLVGPVLADGIEVTHAPDDPIGNASADYVTLTMATMLRFGASFRGPGSVQPSGHYHATRTAVEGDWSSAAYLLGAAAVTRGEVEVAGLPWHTEQADRRIAKVLRHFGASVDEFPDGVRSRGAERCALDESLWVAPDLAPLVGALGCVAEGTTRVRGAAHLRIKESDRIATVVAAARALGCEARELPDGFEIDGPAKHGGLIETRHDHRIAMAFAVAGLAIEGVVIDDPACVAKSYPGFWDDLLRLTSG